MLTSTEKKFSILFFIIVLIELISAQTNTLENLHFIAKPAIVTSLIFLFTKTSIQISKPIKLLTIAALIFSLLGDVLLMLVNDWAHFFTLGLISFLLAHVMYILVFLKHRNKTKSPLGFSIILLVYAAFLFYTLYGGLGEMLIPVIIYMLVILSMATSAYLRKGEVSKLSYSLIFAGAIFFMISDSLLALNKFYKPLPLADISIMLTYALAQYLIVLGILKLKCNNKESIATN